MPGAPFVLSTVEVQPWQNIDSVRLEASVIMVQSQTRGFFFNFNFYFYFILLYKIVLVLPYIDMNPPRVYMREVLLPPFLNAPEQPLYHSDFFSSFGSLIIFYTIVIQDLRSVGGA